MKISILIYLKNINFFFYYIKVEICLNRQQGERFRSHLILLSTIRKSNKKLFLKKSKKIKKNTDNIKNLHSFIKFLEIFQNIFFLF